MYKGSESNGFDCLAREAGADKKQGKGQRLPGHACEALGDFLRYVGIATYYHSQYKKKNKPRDMQFLTFGFKKECREQR